MTLVNSFVVKRLMVAIPLIFIVIGINFFIIRLAPGDPVSFMISGIENAPPEFIELKRKELGLDKPIYEQFIVYMKNIIRGDLGFSWNYNSPVLGIILARLQNTLLLTIPAFIIAFILGVFVGVEAAKRPYSLTDNILSASVLILFSTAHFWRGLMFLLLFGLYLGWFPISGMITVGETGVSAITHTLWHLILPASSLAVGHLALYTKMTRTSMLEVIEQDYIITALSKGCNEQTVFYKHALRNAIIPLITSIGFRIPRLFAGSVVTETIFGWPGIGLLLYNSIFMRDYNMVQGIFLILSIITIMGNLIADIIYTYMDPRIKYK